MTSPGTCDELDTPTGQRAALAWHRLRLLPRCDLAPAAISPYFLFFSYCSKYKNATNICKLRHLQKADAGRQGHQKKTVRSVSSAKNGLATNLGRGSR